jgi:trigger factor
MTERELAQATRRAGQPFTLNQDMRTRIRLDAEVKVRAGLLMAEIARLKEVKVTNDDIEKGYGELAEQTGKNVAKVKAEYRDPKRREMLVAMILEDKILDLLEGAASVTEKD